MSTRGLYTFKASTNYEMDWNVYKHHDGYPNGAVVAIEDATNLAWELPRYESDEFSTAFIAANKAVPGGVRLMPQGRPLEVAEIHCGDIEYRYEISLKKNELYIKAFSVRGSGTFDLVDKLIFEGTLKALKERYPI